MDEGAGGDEVEAEAGVARKALEVDAAAGLGEGAAGDEGEGLLDFGGGEVVEQDDVGAGGEDGGELVEAVDLDLDGEIGGGFAGAGDGGGEVVGGAEEGEVVILQHDAVEEAEAVVPGAAAGDGVFLEHAVARGGFARIEQSGAAGAEGCDVGGGGGGDAGKALEKIEGDALGGEKGARVALDGGEDVAGGGGLAIVDEGLHGGARAVGGKDEREQREAAGDKVGAGDEMGAAEARGGGEGGGGAVAAAGRGRAAGGDEAGAGEILVAGELDEAAEVGAVEVCPGEAQEQAFEVRGRGGRHG